MAGSASAPPDAHVERPREVPTAAELVEKLQGEGFISMREAAEMYGRKTHKSTAARHHLKGVRLPDGTTVRLEAVRVSGALVTSRAAVLRFFAVQNPAVTTPPAAPAPTPKQQQRTAASASKKVAESLGAKR